MFGSVSLLHEDTFRLSVTFALGVTFALIYLAFNPYYNLNLNVIKFFIVKTVKYLQQTFIY